MSKHQLMWPHGRQDRDWLRHISQTFDGGVYVAVPVFFDYEERCRIENDSVVKIGVSKYPGDRALELRGYAGFSYWAIAHVLTLPDIYNPYHIEQLAHDRLREYHYKYKESKEAFSVTVEQALSTLTDIVKTELPMLTGE